MQSQRRYSLLGDPILHLVLIAVLVAWVAIWRRARTTLDYDPISDARVVSYKHVPISDPAFRGKMAHPPRVHDESRGRPG